MKTENEARELWCPMVRLAPLGADETYTVASTRDDKIGRCIASQCAMWRWDRMPMRRFMRADNREALTVEESRGTPLQALQHYDGFEFVPYDLANDPQEEPAGWRETDESLFERREGYCGLAGKPVF